MKIYKIIFASLLILALTACASKTTEQASHEGTPPHWTYEGEEGPAHWGDLDASYATCGAGKSQSPIDVSRLPNKT